MAVTGNFKGTSYPSFKIGKNGALILQGTSVPNPATGTGGEVYIRHGGTPGIFQKIGTTWVELGQAGSGVFGPNTSINNNIAVFDGTTGDLIKDSGITISGGLLTNLAGIDLGKDSGTAKSTQNILFNTTTNATETELFLNGTSGQILVSGSSSMMFKVRISAKNNSNTESYGAIFGGIIVKGALNASTEIVGVPTKDIVANTGAETWDANVSVDTSTGAISVKVIGEAAKTIKWVATVETTESISGA